MGKSPTVVSALFGLASFLPAAHGAAQEHPDTTRYEYLYMNGQFVSPYTSFPAGRDRSQWKCFDGSAKKVFDCTFVRSGFGEFQYIYRARQ